MNETRGTTVLEAMENALEMLEALGCRSGDIHDDLKLAIMYVAQNPKVAKKEF